MSYNNLLINKFHIGKTTYGVDVKKFYYQDVKKAILELIKIKRKELINAEEYFKLHSNNLMSMEEIEEHNETIYNDLTDIREVFGDWEK